MEELEFKLEQICDLIMREYYKYPLIKNIRLERSKTEPLEFLIFCEVQGIIYETVVLYHKDHYDSKNSKIFVGMYPIEIKMKTLHLDNDGICEFESEHWFEEEFGLDIEPLDINYEEFIMTNRHVKLRNSARKADKFLTLIKGQLPEEDYVSLQMINAGNDEIRTQYNL